MPNFIFENMFSRYEIHTKDDRTNILQEVYRCVFFIFLYHQNNNR